MKLSIVIPNYNGRKFLPACLHSLCGQTWQDFEILLADNGSTDGSLAFVSSHYPEVRILSASENRGFSAAANAGIQNASSPYIMLLNNDTILLPSCLARLMKVIEEHPSAFSVGANILMMETPRKTDTAGDFYSVFGYAFCGRQGLAPRFQNRQFGPAVPVFTNCACAAIYRRDLLLQAGLFDQQFFAYLEDVDLGFRARILGYKNYHCPTAVVLHTGSGTTGQKYTAFKVFLSARNNVLLRKKNLTFAQRLLHAPFTFTGTLAKSIYFRRHGLCRSYLKGWAAGLRIASACPKGRGLKAVSSWQAFLRTEPWLLYGSVRYIYEYIRRQLSS